MSGHSKWSTIKRAKAIIDGKRGATFTRIIKEITISAREGGGDPAGNARLRLAIEKAKAANMPSDNMKRAIMRGTGELEGVSYEEITYEGYGPGGTALLIQSVTDNRNRTVADLRHLLSRNGGSLSESGTVAWMFERKGELFVERDAAGEERVMEIVLEAGAEDMTTDASGYTVTTDPATFEAVKTALDGAGIASEGEVKMIAKNTVSLTGKDAEQALKLLDALDSNDDVQSVDSNLDVDEETMASFEG